MVIRRFSINGGTYGEIIAEALPYDPLGLDTSDFTLFVEGVVKSGRNRSAVDKEIQSAERRLGAAVMPTTRTPMVLVHDDTR